MSGDLERVRRVQIRRVSTTRREYDAIVVHLADLRLSADLVDDRQIRLAHRLAHSHGTTLDVAPELQERVTNALGGAV